MNKYSTSDVYVKLCFLQGMSYFIQHGLVSDRNQDIADFLHHTDKLSKNQVRELKTINFFPKYIQ